MDSNPTFGKRIKRYRILNDIRQEDMADKMGVSRATLINYEKGHTSINIEVLNKLKKAYPNFDLNDEKSKPKIINNNTIDFSVLFMVLYRRKNYIITTLLLTMILGLGTSFLFTKYYSSSKKKETLLKKFQDEMEM